MHEAAYIVSVVLTATSLTVFNLLTIAIMLVRRKLRRPSNFPIISFLIGSSIQGVLPAPVYIAKKLDESRLHANWLCDAYRFPYFYCAHIMKICLLVVSMERLIAIKCPFRYCHIVTKWRMLSLLVFLWILTLGIDLIPFFAHSQSRDNCAYVPGRSWGIAVILFFDIMPFLVMAFCYAWIWKVAAAMEMKDKLIRDSLSRAGRDEQQGTAEILELKYTGKSGLVSCHSRESKTLLESEVANTTVKSRRSGKRPQILKYAFEMKATKTSLLLVAVYLVCWGPLGVFYIIDHFCYNCLSEDPNVHMGRTRTAIKLLCFMSSVVAPLAYCWRTREFRRMAERVCCIYRDRFLSVDQTITSTGFNSENI